MTKEMSLTIQGLVVTVLASLVRLFEIDLDQGEITEVVAWLVTGVGAVMVWVGRVRKGDINWYGKRN